MSTLLPIHIAAGSVGIITGGIALFTLKGAALHRRSGVAFVVAMIVLGSTAIAISLWPPVNGGNVLQATLAMYLAVTAIVTVRPQDGMRRRIDLGLTVLILGMVLCYGLFAALSMASPSGTIFEGYTAPMFIAFGSIALLALAGDVHLLRVRELRGVRRIARHLWRMCFALFIASGSFFLGQADEFPASLRIWPVLITLAVLPLVMMLYWLWRVRIRKSLRGLVGIATVESREAATTRAHEMPLIHP